MINFQGDYYHDDRMFVLYLCKGTEEIEGDHIATTIYHENPPENATWCLVTYKNTERYMVARVDTFETKQEAEDYMKHVEPQVPLISLGGQAPKPPLDHDTFLEWKQANDFREYDYKVMYMPGGSNPTEIMLRPR